MENHFAVIPEPENTPAKNTDMYEMLRNSELSCYEFNPSYA